jgi:diguanylate cyclase (GGDEF)-like protein
MVRLREVRLWTWAWLADGLALAATFVHIHADVPELGDRVTLVVYLAGKTIFAVLMVSGARHHLRPGVEPRLPTTGLLVFVAVWSVGLAFAVPDFWLAQLAETTLVGLVFLTGGVTVLRLPRSPISRSLGWAMMLEGALFLYSATLLAPALWGNRAGFVSFSYESFFDAWAELLLALACTAVLTDRSEERLRYANRELLESQERLSRLVDTDPLTGLANRRRLRGALDTAAESGGTLIFIDIDDFKEINDLFGHAVGDSVLQQFARLIVEHFRPEDLVIRWGGDEFLVTAPGMDRGSARSRVEAIRESIRRRSESGPPIVFSAGVAELFPGGDPSAVLEEADRRMFSEKRKP